MPPPDENTTADPTGAAWVVWLVVAVPGLLLLTLTSVRRAGPGELVVVVRGDRVVRARRAGLVARRPVAERFEVVPTGPRVLPMVVRARTRDGVEVVVLADLDLVVEDVEPGTPWQPVARAVRLAEGTVAAAVAQADVATLVDDLDRREADWPGEVSRSLPAGTRASAVRVTEVEARLTPRDPS